MMGVVKRGGCRSTLGDECLTYDGPGTTGDELMEKDFLCSPSRLWRARALVNAVVSGEGGSPKIKNLMKAPMRITTDSWPRRKPSVNDSLRKIGEHGDQLIGRDKNGRRLRLWCWLSIYVCMSDEARPKVRDCRLGVVILCRFDLLLKGTLGHNDGEVVHCGNTSTQRCSTMFLEIKYR